jgi:hypothetical protein
MTRTISREIIIHLWQSFGAFDEGRQFPLDVPDRSVSRSHSAAESTRHEPRQRMASSGTGNELRPVRDVAFFWY